MRKNLSKNSIPGMIELTEQKLLFESASEIDLRENEIIAEFGTFFGKSTFCLAEGIEQNPSKTSSNQLCAYDRYCCEDGGRFSSLVVSYARAGGVEDLLEYRNGNIFFQKIFEHYLKAHLEKNMIIIQPFELKGIIPPEFDIALMHIDCPKYYSEFKYILYRFFPNLRADSIVIFQDFFYHWAATLITAVQLLWEAGVIEIKSSAASSLKVRIIKKPTHRTLLELDLTMQSTPTDQIIDRAIDTIGKLDIERRESFLPRLILAKFQYLWEQKRYRDAVSVYTDFLTQNENIPQSLVNDFMDLMGDGFSVRQRYNLPP